MNNNIQRAQGRALSLTNLGVFHVKKFAPPYPDSRMHRPGDAEYVRELIKASGLSQRAAGPQIGIAERSMRYKVSGEQDLTYAEQFCLEMLADHASAGGSMQVQDRVAPERAGTIWYVAADRPLTRAEIGKWIVGKDRFGAPVHGSIGSDAFGLWVKSADGIDVHNTPIEKLAVYALLDPPPVVF